jgi:serine/threonine protein kinase
LPSVANHPDFIRRFETEAQLSARLEHLHIVPLYDYWRDPDGAYLVMRWLKGGSLRDALQNNPFDPEAAILLILLIDQITSALDTAHRQNVIHRDLKPANILLDEDGNAYLGDFGIAKDLTNVAGNNTGEDVIVGSLDYISPEQARSAPVTPRPNCRCLGVVLIRSLDWTASLPQYDLSRAFV